LDDDGLNAMMAHLPALTHVKLACLRLEDNHADAQMVGCSWEELVVAIVTDVQSLARLPLRCIKRVALRCLGCQDNHSNSNTPDADSTPPSSPAAVLASALAAAPACSFCCHDTTGALSFFCPVSQLPAMLPLLARWEGVRTLVVQPAGRVLERLTPAAVGALGALLEGMPSCTNLGISGFTPNFNALLLPALTRTSVVQLDLTLMHVTEVQLALWCAGGNASRSIVVVMRRDRVPGGIDEVRAAVAESGSVVQLVVQE
jgi:hypothetical protein